MRDGALVVTAGGARFEVRLGELDRSAIASTPLGLLLSVAGAVASLDHLDLDDLASRSGAPAVDRDGFAALLDYLRDPVAATPRVRPEDAAFWLEVAEGRGGGGGGRGATS